MLELKKFSSGFAFLLGPTELLPKTTCISEDTRVGGEQSVTYLYREFPVPGIFHFFGGIGTGIGKNWYRKKVSEPVSEKIGTGKSTVIGIENI